MKIINKPYSMRLFSILSFALITINLCSCKKSDKTQIPIEAKDPERLMKGYFSSEKKSDFTVFVSSVNGVSLFETPSLSKAGVSVEAFGINEKNVGNLSVSNIRIPFIQLSYYLPIDSALANTPLLTGTDVQSKFVSTSTDVPSFDVKEYSPSITNLQYSDLVNYRLNRNTAFTISWTPDAKFKAGTGLIVIMGDDTSNGSNPVITKEVNDGSGSASISTSDLATFGKSESLKVYYAKGYEDVKTISNKTVCFQFITFSWSRIFFTK